MRRMRELVVKAAAPEEVKVGRGPVGHQVVAEYFELGLLGARETVGRPLARAHRDDTAVVIDGNGVELAVDVAQLSSTRLADLAPPPSDRGGVDLSAQPLLADLLERRRGDEVVQMGQHLAEPRRCPNDAGAPRAPRCGSGTAGAPWTELTGR